MVWRVGVGIVPMSALLDRIDRAGPKRLLALDGGGIRGLISIEVLDSIESTLRAQCGGGPDWALSDFFDYFAGTSTGAIIAAGLALGMRVDELRRFYLAHGETMFGPARWRDRFRYRFESRPLAMALRDVFGASRTLGSPELKSLLMVTLNNATTDSPWPLSNNPRARYNNRALANCNLDLPLWQIVRASTAAPTYFPPEVVQVGPTRFVFQDGGITRYNNPAFLLFLMATSAPYQLRWATGPDNLLLVSVGTGSVPNDLPEFAPNKMNLFYLIGAVPKTLMFATLNHQDMMCRMLGRTLAAPPLDKETGPLLASDGGSGLPELFNYVRYNAELTRRGLDELNLPMLKPQDLQRLDDVKHMDKLVRLGRAVGAAQVRPEHFARHIPP
jgi:predicted acylesterase/phospholipase RssA